MLHRRFAAALLAVADTVLVVAGVLVAIRRSGTDPDAAMVTATASSAPLDESRSRGLAAPPTPAPATVTADQVRARPWPDRARAGGRWAASLTGSGDRVAVYAPAVVEGGADHATVALTSTDPRPHPVSGGVGYRTGTALQAPDGTRWYPLTSWQLDGPGDVALMDASAHGATLAGTAQPGWLDGLLRSGVHTATGTFVQRGGQTATQVTLPAGTRVSPECSAAEGPSQPPGPCDFPTPSFTVTVEARPGQRLAVNGSAGAASYGNGEGGVEVEVAGTARIEALGRTWTGLTASLEANDLRGTVVRDGDRWTVTATARSARQVWVDVWPVVDTTLQAKGEYRGRNAVYPVRLTYTNTGAATAQILEVVLEGGAGTVDLGINATKTHDAGLGVHRGGMTAGVGSGRPIDSHLPPGASHDRGLSHQASGPVTLVIRGNFPEVRVTLPVPSAAT